MNFIEWILNKLRSDREEENTWEPIPLQIEDIYPESEYPIEDEKKEDEKTVIIIDL